MKRNLEAKMQALADSFTQLKLNFRKTKDPQRRTVQYVELKIQLNEIWAAYKKNFDTFSLSLQPGDVIVNTASEQEKAFSKFHTELTEELKLAHLRETVVDLEQDEQGVEG